MIYKYFFIHSDFDDVWSTLQSYYHEPDSTRQLYRTLFYTIRNLPVDENNSTPTLRVVFDFDNMIHVAGTPDPIEWLVGRTVVFEEENMRDKYRSDGSEPEIPVIAEFAAHLLYWSTLYDFKTKKRQQKDFRQFLDSCMEGTWQRNPEDAGISLSRKRKQCYYWKEALAGDSATDWSYILDLLRKRIEYHIGYHRYTDRFVNSRHYISRMELCCRLLQLAATDGYDLDGNYVNVQNASRFIGPVFNRDQYESIGKNNSDNCFVLSRLRQAKAYKILWRFLDHNLTYWWD